MFLRFERIGLDLRFQLFGDNLTGWFLRRIHFGVHKYLNPSSSGESWEKCTCVIFSFFVLIFPTRPFEGLSGAPCSGSCTSSAFEHQSSGHNVYKAYIKHDIRIYNVCICTYVYTCKLYDKEKLKTYEDVKYKTGLGGWGPRGGDGGRGKQVWEAQKVDPAHLQTEIGTGHWIATARGKQNLRDQ